MVRVLLEFHGYASPLAAESILAESRNCLERLKDNGFVFKVDADEAKPTEEGLHTHVTLRFGFAAKVLVMRKEITQSGQYPGVLQDIPTIEDAQVTADLLRGTYMGDLKHMRALGG